MPIYNLLEYSSNYYEPIDSLWCYSKDETNFNTDIDNTENFKSFEYKTKLLRNTETEGANGILKNTTIAVLLKYLMNFWRSLEILLINCKAELKLNIVFCLQLVMIMTILILIIPFSISKRQNYMFPSTLYQQKTLINYQNFFVKDLKDQFIGMNIKQKMRIKIQKPSFNQIV